MPVSMDVYNYMHACSPGLLTGRGELGQFILGPTLLGFPVTLSKEIEIL